MRDPSDSDDPFIGTVLRDRFEVRDLIAVGGMGAIYRCFDRKGDNEVAVKVLREELTYDPEVIKRFEREIEATRAIRHPNVIKVLGSGRSEEGRLFLVMELLTGVPAAEYLDDNAPLPSDEVARIGVDIAAGLGACHAAGVIHRDLKPENIMISENGDAKVFDFGLGLQSRDLEPGSERLTAMDMRIGTPMFMAPEYIEGGEATASCDLYALGAILYEAATGQTPFSGAAYEVLHQHVHSPVKPIEERAPERHPAWLRDVIESLLEKSPVDRPQTGEEIVELLRTRAEPASEAITTERSGSSGFSRPLIALVVSFALLWHVLFLIANAGNKHALFGGDLITPHYAVQAAISGGDPYDRQVLQGIATTDGVVRQVPALFQPPSHLLLMAWTAMASLELTHTSSFALNEWALAAVIILLALWWRPLGTAVPVVLAATVAALTCIPLHHQAGQYQLLLIALMIGALWADQHDHPWLSGALFGLACAFSLRPALFAVLWIGQRRFKNLLAALAVFVGLQILAAPLVGIGPTLSFWGSVLPGMLMGDFSGSIVLQSLPTNHALASLLSPLGARLVGIGLLAAAAWSFREWSADPLTAGIRGGAVCALCVLVPDFGREIHLVWLIPGIAAGALALFHGRLSMNWAPFVGISAAMVAFPMKPVVSLYTSILSPGIPLIAPLFLQIKLAAILVLFAAAVMASREESEADCHPA